MHGKTLSSKAVAGKLNGIALKIGTKITFEFEESEQGLRGLKSLIQLRDSMERLYVLPAFVFSLNTFRDLQLYGSYSKMAKATEVPGGKITIIFGKDMGQVTLGTLCELALADAVISLSYKNAK